LDNQTGVVAGLIQNIDSDTEFQFTIRASNYHGYSDRICRIVVLRVQVVWQEVLNQSKKMGLLFHARLSASNAVRYDVIDGVLPPGLALDAASGEIAGTLGDVGADTVYAFTVRAVDATGYGYADAQHRITILYVRPAGSVTLNSTGLYEWSVPSGVWSLTMECWGAGGAGGRWGATPAGCGGGGGGGYVWARLGVTPGEIVRGMVGAGGRATVTGITAGESSRAFLRDWDGQPGIAAYGGDHGRGGGVGNGGGAVGGAGGVGGGFTDMQNYESSGVVGGTGGAGGDNDIGLNGAAGAAADPGGAGGGGGPYNGSAVSYCRGGGGGGGGAGPGGGAGGHGGSVRLNLVTRDLEFYGLTVGAGYGGGGGGACGASAAGKIVQTLGARGGNGAVRFSWG